jgi:hypothetical protein
MTDAIPGTPAPVALSAAAPPALADAPPAPAPANSAVSGQTVTIPLEQLQTFTAIQARLASLEADQRSREDAAKAEQVKLLAQKGEIEAALRTQREEAQRQLDAERLAKGAVEERAKRYALDGELSRALSSQPLVQGGAEQLMQLWRNQFTVEAQGDSFSVRTPTFQSVGDFVSQQLAKPEYAHFVRASNPGGGTAGAPGGGGLSAPTPPGKSAPEPQPKNFGEAIIYTIQAAQKANAADPRLNPAQPMGLRPMTKQA